AGHVDAWQVNLAWAFVAIRVVHSLVQATANVVLLRFSIFMVSWLVLIAMLVREALVIF
ncbi:MAG: MAPEG family protein, partial [Parvibaculales bacterium]